jgi:hypothetical protein
MKVETKPFRIVRLDWLSMPVSRKFTTFETELAARWDTQSAIGLYAFEGKHDGHRNGTILYIGMTAKQGGERPTQSAAARFFRDDASGAMYGSYWDLTLRWAVMDPEDLYGNCADAKRQTGKLAKAVESLLIVSMKPPLNTKEVCAWLHYSAWDLVVGNAGEKGLLLPMLHGSEIYFTHSKDQQILLAVRENPKLTSSDLMERLKLGEGDLKKHLARIPQKERPRWDESEAIWKGTR